MRSALENARAALQRASGEREVFLSLLPERAQTEASQSDGRPQKSGPLDGATVSWKDMIAIKGITATAGSLLWRDDTPAEADAEVVRRASQAGLVSIGVTNQTELAFSGIGYNPHFGTPTTEGRAPPPLLRAGSPAWPSAPIRLAPAGCPLRFRVWWAFGPRADGIR